MPRGYVRSSEFALRLVFDADDLGQVRRRKEGVAFGEAHPLGIEIAFRKVFDRIVVLLYGVVFTGLQHGDDFRLLHQLKQVVVVPGVGSERRFVTLENFHFAVDGEHFFDEGSPEVQQPQGKASLVVRTERRMRFLEELSQIGAQLDDGRGLATAGGAGFEEDAIGDFAGAAEALGVGEAVVAAESPDGLALLLDEGERRVRIDSIAESFEFPVDPVLSEGGLEGADRERCRCLPKTAGLGSSLSRGSCRP